MTCLMYMKCHVRTIILLIFSWQHLTANFLWKNMDTMTCIFCNRKEQVPQCTPLTLTKCIPAHIGHIPVASSPVRPAVAPIFALRGIAWELEASVIGREVFPGECTLGAPIRWTSIHFPDGLRVGVIAIPCRKGKRRELASLTQDFFPLLVTAKNGNVSRPFPRNVVRSTAFSKWFQRVGYLLEGVQAEWVKCRKMLWGLFERRWSTFQGGQPFLFWPLRGTKKGVVQAFCDP